MNVDNSMLENIKKYIEIIKDKRIFNFFCKIYEKYNKIMDDILNEIVMNEKIWTLIKVVFVCICIYYLVKLLLKIFKTLKIKTQKKLSLFKESYNRFAIMISSKEMPIIESIQEEIATEVLVHKKDFFWIFSFLRKEKIIQWINLLNNLLVLLLNTDYLKKFIKDFIIVEEKNYHMTDDFLIQIAPICIIHDKAIVVDINLINKGDKNIEFFMAQKKIRSALSLSLELCENGKIVYENIEKIKIEDEEFLQKGSILPKENYKLKIVFNAVNWKILRLIKKIKITGELKFKGSRNYQKYEIELDNISTSYEKLRTVIISTYGDNGEFDIIKQGGIVTLIVPLILVLFLINIIFLENKFIGILFWIISFLLYVLAVILNIAIIQYLYELISKNLQE